MRAQYSATDGMVSAGEGLVVSVRLVCYVVLVVSCSSLVSIVMGLSGVILIAPILDQRFGGVVCFFERVLPWWEWVWWEYLEGSCWGRVLRR